MLAAPWVEFISKWVTSRKKEKDMWKRTILALVVGTCVPVLMSSNASADAVLVGQNRNVFAGGNLGTVTDTDAAVAFENVTLSASINSQDFAGFYNALATQNSTLSGTLFTNDGNVSADFTPFIGTIDALSAAAISYVSSGEGPSNAPGAAS